MMRRRSLILPLAVVMGIWVLEPPALLGQNGSALIRQGIGAYQDFDPQRALTLLRRGVDPRAGAPDSVWALGVQYLVQILHEQGDESTARTWARWAVRRAPALRLDSLNLLSQVLAEFEAARRFTAPVQSDAHVQADWIWPSGDPGSAPGRIELGSGETPGGVTATIVGVGTLQDRASLSAGSYEVEAGAAGYLTARITREVLPGVTTVLTFVLDPVRAIAAESLTRDVRQHVERSLVAMAVTRFGIPQPSCAAAVRTEDGVLFTTYDAIRGADALDRADGGGSLSVAGYDVSRDFAALRDSVSASDSLGTSTIIDGEYAWGFGLRGCDVFEDARIRISRLDGEDGVLRFEGRVPSAVLGSPVVGSDGVLLGLISSDSTALVANDVMERARASQESADLRAPVDVARVERHRYGTVSFTAPAGAAARVRVTPLEDWHWPELARAGPVPFVFAGPEGRYRVAVTVADQVRRDSVFAVIPGTGQQFVVPIAQVSSARKKGGFPWLIAVLGAVGAGTAAIVLGGGGDPPPPGSITIRIPDPR